MKNTILSIGRFFLVMVTLFLMGQGISYACGGCTKSGPDLQIDNGQVR